MITELESFLDNVIVQKYKYIPNDIMNGKAGLAIYYASIGTYKDKNKLYNRCVNDVLTGIPDDTPISFENGLLGICISIECILSNYKNGNADYVLSDLDSKIYKEFSLGIAKNGETLDQFIEVVFYISIRLKYSMKNRRQRSLFMKISMYWIENIYSRLSLGFFKEPIPFKINQPFLLFVDSLIRFYNLSIYKNRIVHILNEMAYNALPNIPCLHANRLALLYVVKKACVSIPELSEQWHESASILSQNISIDKILNNEIQNRQIYFLDGLSGVYLLMIGCNRLFGYNYFNVNKDLYFRRVMDSDTTKKLKKEFSLASIGLNGYWGIYLLYKYMNKNEYSTK